MHSSRIVAELGKRAARAKRQPTLMVPMTWFANKLVARVCASWDS
jgi:hypothetical protein